MAENRFRIVALQDVTRTKVYLNDVEIRGIRRVTFEIAAEKALTMSLEIVGEIFVEGEFVENDILTVKRELPFGGARKESGE